VGIESIMDELYSSHKLNPDVTSDQSSSYDSLLRSPLVTRCLSMQHALGSRGGRPTVSAKLAWVAMNLKLTSVTLHYANNIINNNLAEAAQSGICLGSELWRH